MQFEEKVQAFQSSSAIDLTLRHRTCCGTWNTKTKQAGCDRTVPQHNDYDGIALSHLVFVLLSFISLVSGESFRIYTLL